MAGDPVLTQVVRGTEVEAEHRGAFAVIGPDGVVESAGDIDALRYPRSSLKPFQALPLLARSLEWSRGLSAAEVAVMVASHSGGSLHLAAVLVRSRNRRQCPAYPHSGAGSVACPVRRALN